MSVTLDGSRTPMAETGFALVLNLHQPTFNLDDLLDHAESEAREILWAMDCGRCGATRRSVFIGPGRTDARSWQSM